MQMAQFECPKHWNPSVPFISGVGWTPFSDNWFSGAIRMVSPVWKCKSWKFIRTKVTQQDANDPVWMPQALRPLCLLHFLSWENSLFWLLALWGNKNGLPSMKVQKLNIYKNKSDSTGCKWPSLNAPGTEAPLSHPILKLGEFPFPLLALWGNKNWPPSMKVKKLEIF